MTPFNPLETPASAWLDEVRAASARLRPHLYDATPLLRSEALSKKTGREVYLKLETRQPTGAYKVRPALNGILCHLDESRQKGVLTTSSGNFAQAVAWAAAKLGVRAAIVMTEDTAPYKLQRTREHGAEVILCGPRFEDRFETVDRLQRERGSIVLHPFDSPETLAGDGTLALELVEQLGPETPFTVLCPASGGGLIAAIAATLAAIAHERTAVAGFQPEAGGAIVKSLRAGARVNVGKVRTIADALVASMPGENTLELIRRHVRQFELVSESEIAGALRHTLEEEKLWIEPGGAAAVAGLLTGRFPREHQTVVCVLTGANLDPGRLASLLGNP